MKNQLLCIISLAFSLIACEKESEFVQKADIQSLSQRSECIDISTTHWLTGFGKDQPIREMATQESKGGNMLSRRYVIEASGDAMSESYARGFSELNLVYDTKTYRLSGELTTTFYYGEVLELKFDGESHVRFDGQTMNLRVSVKEAKFNTGQAILNLSYGDIHFILPSTPEGSFGIEINTNTLVCEP